MFPKDDEDRFLIIVVAIVLLFILMLCAGCTKTVYVPVHSISTEYRDKIQRDSIYLHDSIRITIKGDTVKIEKYKYLYQDKFVHDTIIKIDSIPKPYPVKGDTVYINELKWYQEASVWFTSLVLVALALYLGIKYRGKIFALLGKLIFKG
jgi:uncharacterized membrane protein